MSDASPSGRRITVRSVSCRGVKSFVPFQKPPLYVAVSLGGRREKAPADPDGGVNPDWDGAVFAFDFDAGEGNDGLLQFEVKAQLGTKLVVPLLGTKLVGTTCVPVSRLSSGGGDGTVPRRESYQVLAPDGKPNGSLSFVYAVTGGGGAYQQPLSYTAPNGAGPEQDLRSCCTRSPPPSSLAYPSPATPNFSPAGSSYPPPPSSLAYPSPATPNFSPAGSSYPPPPSSLAYPSPATPNFSPAGSSYPPPPSSLAYPPPAMQNFAPPGSSYLPPPVSTSLYPPVQDLLPPNDYPPPPQMMHSLFPGPVSNAGLNSSYPLPPPPPPPPRSVDRELRSMAPSFQDSVVTYPSLPGTSVPSGGSYYPPSGLRHHEDGASSPYYYPYPGARW